MSALLALLFATAQPLEPPLLHRCRERMPDFEGMRGGLTFDKSFRVGGAPATFDIILEDESGTVTTGLPPTTRTRLTLHWVTQYRDGVPSPAGYLGGEIQVELFGDARAQTTPGDARWRRVLMDRDNLLRRSTLPDGGEQMMVPHLGLYLASELLPLATTPRRLNMSLDSLFAWGSGRERLIAYETVVIPWPRRGRDRERAIWLERVVGAYQIDLAALARLAARARAAGAAWEAGLTDVARRCERIPIEEDEWGVVGTGSPSN